MAQITAKDYIAALPANRQATIKKMRTFVNKALPDGYVEYVTPKMLMWSVPLERFPNTYNGHPLMYVALASEKSYCSLHLMSVYGSKKHETLLRDGFKAAGKKLNMGKACVRFETIDELPLEVIADLIASVGSEQWIQIYQSSRTTTKG